MVPVALTTRVSPDRLCPAISLSHAGKNETLLQLFTGDLFPFPQLLPQCIHNLPAYARDIFPVELLEEPLGLLVFEDPVYRRELAQEISGLLHCSFHRGPKTGWHKGGRSSTPAAGSRLAKEPRISSSPHFTGICTYRRGPSLTTRLTWPRPVRSSASMMSPGPKRRLVPSPTSISTSPWRVIMY